MKFILLLVFLAVFQVSYTKITPRRRLNSVESIYNQVKGREEEIAHKNNNSRRADNYKRYLKHRDYDDFFDHSKSEKPYVPENNSGEIMSTDLKKQFEYDKEHPITFAYKRNLKMVRALSKPAGMNPHLYKAIMTEKLKIKEKEESEKTARLEKIEKQPEDKAYYASLKESRLGNTEGKSEQKAEKAKPQVAVVPET